MIQNLVTQEQLKQINTELEELNKKTHPTALIPKMTSATAPEGKVTYGGAYNSGTPWKCFNMDYIDSINALSNDGSSNWMWVIYEFKSLACVCGATMKIGSQGGGATEGYELLINGTWTPYTTPHLFAYYDNVSAIKFKVYNNSSLYRSYIYNCQCVGYYK